MHDLKSSYSLSTLIAPIRITNSNKIDAILLLQVHDNNINNLTQSSSALLLNFDRGIHNSGTPLSKTYQSNGILEKNITCFSWFGYATVFRCEFTLPYRLSVQ